MFRQYRTRYKMSEDNFHRGIDMLFYRVIFPIYALTEIICGVIARGNDDCDSNITKEINTAFLFAGLYIIVCFGSVVTNFQNRQQKLYIVIPTLIVFFACASIFTVNFTLNEISDKGDMIVSSNYCFGENFLIVRAHLYSVIGLILITVGTRLFFKHAYHQKETTYSNEMLVRGVQIPASNRKLHQISVTGIVFWTIFSAGEIMSTITILYICDGYVVSQGNVIQYFNVVVNSYVFVVCALNWLFCGVYHKELFTECDSIVFKGYILMIFIDIFFSARSMYYQNDTSNGDCYPGSVFLTYKLYYYIVEFLIIVSGIWYYMKATREFNQNNGQNVTYRRVRV